MARIAIQPEDHTADQFRIGIRPDVDASRADLRQVDHITIVDRADIAIGVSIDQCQTGDAQTAGIGRLCRWLRGRLRGRLCRGWNRRIGRQDRRRYYIAAGRRVPHLNCRDTGRRFFVGKRDLDPAVDGIDDETAGDPDVLATGFSVDVEVAQHHRIIDQDIEPALVGAALLGLIEAQNDMLAPRADRDVIHHKGRVRIPAAGPQHFI